MLSIIFLVYSLLVFVVSLALCIWLGYRRGVFNSAMRLGFFLLSGILAFFITKLLTNLIGTTLSNSLITQVGEDLSKLTAMPSVMQAIAIVGGGLLAPIVFLLVFFAIDKLSFFAYIPLKKKFATNKRLHNIPHDKLFGAMLGGVLALAITIPCVLPIGGYPSLLAEIDDKITASSFAEEVPDEMIEAVEEWAKMPAVKVNYAVSGWLFRGLTSNARQVISSCFSLLDLVEDLQNAKDLISLFTAFQELPDESLDLLISIAKDALVQATPEGSPYQVITNILSKSLDKLPDVRNRLSAEAYAKEIETLANVTALISDSSSITGPQVITTALSSTILTETIVENGDEIKEELSEITSEIPTNEKEEIKTSVEEYADEFDVDDEVVSSVLSIFGIS